MIMEITKDKITMISSDKNIMVKLNVESVNTILIKKQIVANRKYQQASDRVLSQKGLVIFGGRESFAKKLERFSL